MLTANTTICRRVINGERARSAHEILDLSTVEGFLGDPVKECTLPDRKYTAV